MKKIINLVSFLICHFCLLANISSNFIQGDSVFTAIDSAAFYEIQPIGFVSDFEHVFSADERIELNRIIVDYEKSSSNEIVIVSIDTIPSNWDFDQFSISLFNQWGIGKKNINNGILILFSKNLRKIRITTGRGTEKKITDEDCRELINKLIVPYFKEGDYFSGIEYAIKSIIKKWKE